MKVKHKIWFEKDGKVLFGEGRSKLFRAIDELHSLNGAAKKLNMSYRAAWGRLKATEERIGMKLVKRSKGKGMYLTDEAVKLLEQFDQLEQRTELFLEENGQSILSSLKSRTKRRTSKKHPDATDDTE